MGTIRTSSAVPAAVSMADALFSAVEQRVLGLLFGQPARWFQSAEIIRLVGSGTGGPHRVLRRLVASRLVDERLEGRQKYYRPNPDSPLFSELVALIRKTVGLAGPLADALASLAEGITAAFVYGSVAGGADDARSDIDVLVLSEELDYPTLFEALQSAEQQLGRSIDVNLVTPAEWRRRRSVADGFAARVDAGPRMFLIGSEDDIG